MVWTITDFADEQKVWEMSEDDIDDEFDDIQLMRLGIDIHQDRESDDLDDEI